MKLKITQEEKINILEQYVSKKLPKSIQGVAPYNNKKVMKKNHSFRFYH